MIQEYSLEVYEKMVRNRGFDDIKYFEHWLLLYRFGHSYNDKLLFELVMELNEKVKNETVNYIVRGKYLSTYEKYTRSEGRFYLSSEDRTLFHEFVSRHIEFSKLKELFTDFRPRYVEFDVFRGYYYYYDGRELTRECRWDEVYDSTLKALKDTRGRVRSFLKALINLYIEEKPLFLSGYSLSKIQERVIKLEGKVILPTPVDYTVLKAYKIYYKSGSRRYPEHTLPMESLPPMEKALEEYR